MSINLRISLIIFSLALIIVTCNILKKGRMPEKYSLLWFFIAIVILFVAIIPTAINFVSTFIGFEAMSNMIIGIVLVLLTFLTLALTIIISGQKKKTTLLIQEISIMKAKLDKYEK